MNKLGDFIFFPFVLRDTEFHTILTFCFNFSGIFPTQLPKRMERKEVSLPSLQLWRKSRNKRALEVSSSTIE